MVDEGRNYPDPGKLLKRKHPEKLHTNNVFNNDCIFTNKRRDILLTWMPQTILKRTEVMSQWKKINYELSYEDHHILNEIDIKQKM